MRPANGFEIDTNNVLLCDIKEHNVTDKRLSFFAAIAATLTLACVIGILPAQENPATGGDATGGPAAAGDKPAGADLEKAQQAEQDLQTLLSMKKEDLDKFLAQASKDRLLAERQQVVAEIVELFPPSLVKAY